MLLRFELGNFLSFDKKQEFTLFPGNQKKKSERLTNTRNGKLLNLSVIYGANASGKTNFIRSMAFSKELILKGIDKLKYGDEYFKNNSENKDKESYFEYEIIVDDQAYAYGFKVNLDKKKIIGEWLYELNKKEEKCIYDLSFDDSDENSIDELYSDNERFLLLKDDISEMDNSLILSEVVRRKYYQNDNSFIIFKEIYNWFENDLRIVSPSGSPGPIDEIFKDDLKDNILDMLKKFDTGIKDFSYISRSKEESAIPKFILDDFLDKTTSENKENFGIVKSKDHLYRVKVTNELNKKNIEIKELLFKHSNEKDSPLFMLSEESDGTKRLIELMTLMSEENNSKTFIIDEIDRSLHPQLTYKFLQLFLNKKNQNQLIASTHESMLLDQELLRRDEIWFIHKNSKTMASEIYSLDKFKERFDKDIHKAYLEGRYGAVPLFKEFDCMKVE